MAQSHRGIGALPTARFNLGFLTTAGAPVNPTPMTGVQTINTFNSPSPVNLRRHVSVGGAPGGR